MLSNRIIRAKTLGEAALAERAAVEGPGGFAPLGVFLQFFSVALILLRLFSWLWIVVSAFLLLPAVMDWINGRPRASEDVMLAGKYLVGALLSAWICGRLIGRCNVYADKAAGTAAITHQAQLAGGILDRLLDAGDENQTCRYRREIRSLHSWVDDGGYHDKSFDWFEIKTPWGDDEVTITANFAYDILDNVELTSTWTIRGPLQKDEAEIRRILADAYDVVSVDATELVICQYRSIQQLFCRGTSATPSSMGNDLDSDVLLGALPSLLPPAERHPTAVPV